MKDMNNPFDNKIKESLENFEMPYDAGAWTALEQQLPAATGGAAGAGLGWKAVAVVAVIATTVATALYLNQDNEPLVDMVPIEELIEASKLPVQAESKEETNTSTAKKPVTIPNEIAERQSQPPISTDNTYNVAVEEAEKPATENASDEKIQTTSIVETTEVSSSEKNRHSEAVAVNAKPFIVKFIPSAVTVCAGENVSFINESSDRSARMSWDFGDGTTSSETDAAHNYVLPGNYTVNLTGSSTDREAVHSVSVIVNAAPMPMLSFEQKLEGFETIPLYRFATTVQPNETVIWNFSDGTRIEGSSAEHLFRKEGTSTAKLTVTNNLGCSTSVNREFEMRDPFILLAPTGFTPDGDGLNETFMPQVLVDMGVGFLLTIKNARGQEVYRTGNAQEPWNGSLNNNGSKLEAGIYVWTVVLKENIAKNKVFKNTINLQR